MKHLPTLSALILGLIFLVFGTNFFLNFIPIPSPPEGSPPALFMAAIYPTGYLAMVKVLEIAGGGLVLFRTTRMLGLMILGPIVVNILAYQVFLSKSIVINDPPSLLITLTSLHLLWQARQRIGRFLWDERLRG